MEMFFALAACLLSLISCVVSVLLFNRNQDAQDAQSKLRSFELELADVADKLSAWQRRDAARNRGVSGSATNEQRGPIADQHGAGDGSSVKSQLRAVARGRGLMP